MTYISYGWAYFQDYGAFFSESFRKEMAAQLLIRFYSMMDITEEVKHNKFKLYVDTANLKTLYRDGYAFGFVEIVTPIALAIELTAYWKINNGENIETAAQLDIWNDENIEFGWCIDFNREDFLEYLKPKSILTKEELNSHFDYEYDYTLYPDLSFTICFSQKVFKDDLNTIEEIFVSTLQDIYVSDLTNEDGILESGDNNETFGIFDFHNNDFKIATNQLMDAIKKVGQNDVGKLITKIIVE